MPVSHRAALTVWELPREPGRAACRMSAPCPSQRWSEIRRTCIRSSRPWGRCAPVWVACTQTERRYRRSGTVYSNEARSCIWDTFHSGRIPPPAPHHNLNSAPGSLCRPCVGCADRDDPSRLEGPLVVASGPGLSSRVFPASPRHDSRGGHTCDPQTPPSVSRKRTVTANHYTTELISVFSRDIQSDSYIA